MTRCPRCHVELERIVKGTDEAWLCRQCDGVLLRKLDPYLEMTEEELLDSPVSESLFADHPEVDVDPPVGCPLCGQAMRRFVYSNDSGITVDSCPAGHGIWLDDGELARIYDYLHGIEPLDENLDSVSQADKATLVMREFPKMKRPPPDAPFPSQWPA